MNPFLLFVKLTKDLKLVLGKSYAHRDSYLKA